MRFALTHLVETGVQKCKSLGPQPAPNRPPDRDKIDFSELNMNSVSSAFEYPQNGAEKERWKHTTHLLLSD
jgi:hypothetical protein